jgi:alpha-tubulin suppressor-like RCC1 family protein
MRMLTTDERCCACVCLGCFCCIGVLGIGSTETVGDNKTPGNSTTVNFGTDAAVTAVSIGGRFVCAIVNGTAKCWGNNEYGQLGQGNTLDLGATAATIPAKIKPIK